jgi:hypothetical protein
MAMAIALGATSMSDIALLGHLIPVPRDAPSGPTVRRALDLAGASAALDRIARARAKGRARLDADRRHACRVPWLVIAGKTPAGWVVIDMDATLVTAHSDKQGTAPTWKKATAPVHWQRVFEYARVPCHAAAARQRRIEHLHRPPRRARRRDPAAASPFRRKVLIRIDGSAPATSSSLTCSHCPPAPEGPLYLRVDDHRSR